MFPIIVKLPLLSPPPLYLDIKIQLLPFTELPHLSNCRFIPDLHCYRCQQLKDFAEQKRRLVYLDSPDWRDPEAGTGCCRL